MTGWICSRHAAAMPRIRGNPQPSATISAMQPSSIGCREAVRYGTMRIIRTPAIDSACVACTGRRLQFGADASPV